MKNRVLVQTVRLCRQMCRMGEAVEQYRQVAAVLTIVVIIAFVFAVGGSAMDVSVERGFHVETHLSLPLPLEALEVFLRQESSR